MTTDAHNIRTRRLLENRNFEITKSKPNVQYHIGNYCNNCESWYSLCQK